MDAFVTKLFSRTILLVFACGLSGGQLAWADAPPSVPGNPVIRLYDGAGGELVWQRSKDDRSVRGYEVTKNGVSLGILDALSVYDASLSPDVSYTFTIAAIDDAGQRSALATVSTDLDTGTADPSTGTTDTGTSVPDSQPTTAGTPTGLRALVYSSTTAELFWDRPTPSLGKRYEVSRNGKLLTITQGVSFFDDDLTGGRSYTYEVVTIGVGGERSAPAGVLVQTAGNQTSTASQVPEPESNPKPEPGTNPEFTPEPKPEIQPASTGLSLAELLGDRDTVFGADINTFPEPTFQDDEGSLYWEYDIVDDQLSSAVIAPAPAHQDTWRHFAELIPQSRRTRLLRVRFVIGLGSAADSTATMYYVFGSQAGQGTATLTLYENFTASYGYGPVQNTSTFQNKEYVYVHEYAHLLSYLDASIPTPESLENEPDDVALWPPVLGLPADSLFGRFILEFWQHDLIDLLNSASVQSSADLVYSTYPDRFVSRYAATNYNEDFAESFTHFVVRGEKPSPGSYPGSDKILFFWNEPGLVSLRDDLRARMLAAR